MTFTDKVRKHGITGGASIATKRISQKIRRCFDPWRFRSIPKYANPTSAELLDIETGLRDLSITLNDYAPPPEQFHQFVGDNWFPDDYHGGRLSGVWDEKHLEHWIAGELLGLADYQPLDVYVDIAACNSPWAKSLRERNGLSAFAIDLAKVGDAYRGLSYYRSENATKTSFADSSIRGASLQCAYEMFLGEHDIAFIGELARILQPGGKAIILPLYMHTHYCAYSTPEYFGKGHSDPNAKEYVRMDCYGVPSSRKYDAAQLLSRVLVPIEQAGMSYRLYVLRNKEALGCNIYCHFILEICK